MNTPTDPLDQPINLTLTARETNYVLSVLGQRPFAEVASLISKIKSQGDTQFVPPVPEAAEAA